MGQIGLAAGASSLGWTALYQLCLYNIYRLLGRNKTLYRQLVHHAAWSTRTSTTGEATAALAAWGNPY
jgi:hypothetical protein